MTWARTSHRYLVALIALALVIQIFLAGAGAFHATGYNAHRTLGWALLFLAVLAFVVALVGLELVRRTAVLLVLVALQAVLGVLGTGTDAWFGAVHAVNAFAVLAAAGALARNAWVDGHTHPAVER